MTDKERREGDALEKLIQTAYDFSDEQLLAELEEAEATLSDSDFPGIEDRVYQKLKARMAEEEDNSETTAEETPTTAPVVAPAAEEKKVVRFGKKKVLVVGILAAAFVGMLGVTAIGGKNYFFRDIDTEKEIIFANDQALRSIGDLNEVYAKIEEELEVSILKLSYIPEHMKFNKLEISNRKAIISFEYLDKTIYYIVEKKESSASVGVNSDRKKSDRKITNKWISEDIYLEEEQLQDGISGYGVSINIDTVRYRIIGQLEESEMIKLVENLSF